ncbi:MAG: type I glutamate--ammonia ligase [Calditrichaeota bacterium]|nr:type I glutamate--ammonia ligase [Calditrichota bacterium]
MNIESLLKFAREQAVETVDIKYSNLFGAWHHVTLPANLLKPELFTKGVGFDGSSVPGYGPTSGSSDLLVIPDINYHWLDPFWDAKTISFIGSIHHTDNLAPFANDPRRIAQRAEEYLIETGIADLSVWGPEFEFYIFDAMRFMDNPHQAGYSIISNEAEWGNAPNCDCGCSHQSTTPIAHKGGYHIAPPQDRYYNLRDEICRIAVMLGLDIKYHHHEVGAPGQSEIECNTGPLLKTADDAMLLKYICKMAALKAGCSVTFMPKPLYNEAGNGMHFHQHLFKGGKPLFYDANGYAQLSELALYYIGGLLKHGPALVALVSPSTNSYKRLVPGFEAPVKAIFGLGNRSAAIRIPKYAADPMDKRIEFRPPDATGNIYLSMAAQLMAGIDGILNKINPSEHGFGPYDSDITKLPEDQKCAIPNLPTALDAALRALQDDHTFLLAGNVFTTELLETWVKWKMEKEFIAVNQRPHPYEMKLYYDV